MLRVLVVGQTPPPYMGQAMMTQVLLEGKFERVELFHIRLNFSKSIEDIGHFQIRKIFHLLYVVLAIIYSRFRYKIHALYFMPAPPNFIPVYRDIVILFCVRWLFKRIIFHFRAGGISQLYSKLPRLLRFMFRWAYFNADVAIRLSEFNPPDGQVLQAKREFIVPNGIEDRYANYQIECQQRKFSNILFVGILRESKGIMVLLEAVRFLAETGKDFHISFMGGFGSDQFKQTVLEYVFAHRLEKYVDLLGVLTGEAKWRVFAQSGILCFPTFYEYETFGTVIIEAMQFEMPVVATNWRGIPSIVEDAETGYLVSIKDSKAIAEKLLFLLENPDQAEILGKQGRKRYLQYYSLEKFYKNMEAAFVAVND